MRGHFRYLSFETFPLTPITPQCKVFWALLSNPKHSGVPVDSKSPTLGVLDFTPTLGQSGVATTWDIIFPQQVLSNFPHRILSNFLVFLHMFFFFCPTWFYIKPRNRILHVLSFSKRFSQCFSNFMSTWIIFYIRVRLMDSKSKPPKHGTWY
jgi:hypothetical protein